MRNTLLLVIIKDISRPLDFNLDKKKKNWKVTGTVIIRATLSGTLCPICFQKIQGFTKPNKGEDIMDSVYIFGFDCSIIYQVYKNISTGLVQKGEKKKNLLPH